jgi:hypothetical protein
VYQGGARALKPATAASRIVNERDAVVHEERVDLGVGAFASRRAADYRVDLPLADLVADRYLLTIEVEEGSRRVRRDVRFEVR